MLYIDEKLVRGGKEARLRAYITDTLSFNQEVNKPLVLICPGGAYAYTSEREAEPVAMQFVAGGCHAAILDYTCAPDAEFPESLCQLAEAVIYCRRHAGEWHVDPDRIFVTGFSAGGHLACSLGVFWNSVLKEAAPDLDCAMAKPNGLILGYPVITSGSFCHSGSIKNLMGSRAGDEKLRLLLSLENQVTADCPPVFLWGTYEDQSVPMENSLLLLGALRKAGVSAEYHLFRRGGHGLSLSNKEVCAGEGRGGIDYPEVMPWIDLAVTWIRLF